MSVRSVCPSTEGQLVMLSAAGREMDIALRQALAGPFDAGVVVQIAVRENVVSPLHRRAADLGPGGRELAARLAKLAMVSDFHQSALESRLHDAVRRLGHAGIETLLIKGAALAVAHYESFQARPMYDIDVIVRERDALRAHELLRTDGWVVPDAIPPDQVERRYRAHHHLAPLVDDTRLDIGFEIHTDLFPAGHPFAFDAASVWAGARTVERDGTTFQVPAPIDLALHNCAHFAWSHWLRSGAWRAFADLATLGAQRAFDWQALAERAQETRASNACYWTAHLARRMSGVPVPADFERLLAPGLSGPLHAVLVRHFACDTLPVLTVCPSTRLRKVLWTAAMAPGRSGHGSARPWHHEQLPEPGRMRASVAERMRDLRYWPGYLKALIAPTRGTGATPS